MQNPYTPPAGGEQEWQPQPGPEAGPPGVVSSAPKVFGVLSIIFASLILLFSLIGACSSAFGRSMGGGLGSLGGGQQTAQFKVMFQYMASIYNYILIQQLIFLVMSAALLAIGIGQLKYKRWARSWSVYWGWAGLISLGVVLAISFFAVGPMYKEMFAAMAKNMPSGAMPMAKLSSGLGAMMGGAMGVMYLIFYSPYPILMLLFFNKANVKQAMDR
jgi:hypothetical protein